MGLQPEAEELQSEYEGFDHYKELATRPLPIVILEPIGE